MDVLPDISFQYQIGSGVQGTGNGQFDTPFGVAAGSIAVADSNNFRIQVFDDSGNFQFSFPTGGSTFVARDGEAAYFA